MQKPIFALQGKGLKKFFVAAKEIWMCYLRKENLDALMGSTRVERVGPRLTKLCGQYYMRLVFFANREGASGTYDEAKEVQKIPIFATKGEGFKKFTGGAEEIWVCWLTKANLEAMVP
ncbi:hypothetical protein ACFX13_023606 [Malus domestica]